MMKPLALVLGLMVVMVCADSKFTIWTPTKLVEKLKDTSQKFSIGNFGHVPWDKMVNGYVYPANTETGCTPHPFWLNTTHKGDRTPIMIVRRGDCNFVTKAHLAQLAGARMLIVVHNETFINLDMIDDESGQSESLHIPSILISKTVGDAILNEIKEGHDLNHKNPSRVSIVVSFEINKNDTSNYEVWLSSSDKHSIKFLENYHREYNYLNKVAKMQIRTVVNEHIGYAPYKTEREHCISGGRYCSTHPSTDKSHYGRDNLMEDLRQHCIAEKRMDKFYEYVEKYGSHCFTSTNMAACSTQNMKNLGINVDEIIQCVNATFVRADTSIPINYWLDNNTYFEKELSDRRSKGISHWPAAFVNGIAIRSTLNAENLFETVCASLKNPPKACIEKELEEEQKTSHNPEDYKRSSAFWVVLSIILGLLVLFVLVFYFVYRRIVKQQLARELSLSVNSAVANYVKMNEGRGPSKQP